MTNIFYGQFALDSWLYKEAVLKFGTVIEAIIDTELRGDRFGNLIDQSNYSTKADMHLIRKFRNQVHPNRLQNFSDINRSDALHARFTLGRILIEIVDLT